MNSFLAWLRQGSTQTGIQALGFSLLGAVTGAVPVWGAVVGAIGGIAGLIFPENASVQQQIAQVATQTMQTVAAISPSVAKAVGINPAAAAAPTTPAAHS